MTRITVHALGTDRLVVCGSEGRRWILDAPAAEAHSAEVGEALQQIRASAPDEVVVVDDRDIELGSLRELEDSASASAEPRVVFWRYAGVPHRIRLDPVGGPADAALVVSLLRAGTSEPQIAEALTQRPLLADPLHTRRGTVDAPPPDVLERWSGGAWVPHATRPAPSIDPVTGILRRIVARPTEPWHPRQFHHLHAELPFLSSIDSRFQPDQLAPAGTFASTPAAASHAALISGIAHYCGAYLGQGELRRATAQELRAERARVLTAAEWRPHDPALHDIPGFPFVRDNDEAATWWLTGTEDGEVCWVPLALVHAGYLASGLQPLPQTNTHNLVGLSAGANLAEAADRAAAHVIAHDAVARWWRDPVPLPGCPLPEPLRAAGDQPSLALTVLAVPSATGTPVRLAVADDRHANIVSLGFAAAADSEDAALAALAEALVQHASARDLDSPNSLIRDAERIGNGGVAGLADHDPGRGYAKTAFADSRRLIDPMCHVQYGLSESSVARVRQRTTPLGLRASETARARPHAALLASGTRVVTVDVTTERVREAGFAACRVLAPDLERLTPAAFPLHITETQPYPGW